VETTFPFLVGHLNSRSFLLCGQKSEGGSGQSDLLCCLMYNTVMNKNGLFFAAVAAVILNDNNEVLLTQRSFARDHHPGEWEITTGRLLQHESFEQALKREIQEELSIEVTILDLLGTFHFYRGEEKAEHVGVQFLCKIRSGVPTVDDVEEIAVQWLPILDAISLVKDQSIKQVLRDALAYMKPAE
jgi:8-oxo-dGTP diphosphatase